jgi:predicted Zn finger-like uncharacterized protein
MDVRCEKCLTEYELDEARLKPGGVTVKCTQCGHTFKVYPPPASTAPGAGSTGGLGAGSNAGSSAGSSAGSNAGSSAGSSAAIPRAAASYRAASPAPSERADPLFDEAATERASQEPATMVDRQWMLRLEGGQHKVCRELATLQQWIVSGVVTREAMISRTGKTWKRLGDVAELAQYFEIADEARTTRDARPTGRTGPTPPPGRGTMLGIGAAAPHAAGGTILPDSSSEIDDEARTTRVPPPLPPRVPPGAKTPPMGSVVTPAPVPTAAVPPPGLPRPAPATPRPAAATPRPAPATPRPAGAVSAPPPVPATPGPIAAPPSPAPSPLAPDGRSTAPWAHDPVRSHESASAAGRSGPFVGKLAAIPDEPAFAAAAGRALRGDPDPARALGRAEEDDAVLPPRRGSRAGLWIALGLLALGGAAAAGVYMFVLRPAPLIGSGSAAPGSALGGADAAGSSATAAAAPDAAPSAPAADAAAPTSPLIAARDELPADHEPRLRAALAALAGQDTPEALAVRAHLASAIAQSLLDRAALATGRGEADQLRRDAQAVAIEAATAAQRAVKATPADAGAATAMAAALRVAGKPAAAVQRYSAGARTHASAVWLRELHLGEALLLARDGRLDDARAALSALDNGAGRLESSGDVRPRFQLARIALAQGQRDAAKAGVEQVLAAQPEHAAARALAARLETAVAGTDPLPPEEPRPPAPGSAAPRPAAGPGAEPPTAAESYERLVARANAAAESSCATALAIYARALEQKPNGAEALTGMGYCHIDAKQFASAFGKFRAAIAVSPRYEPALWGVAEAYQQQGRKEQAVEALQRYLEAFPGAPKALRQLERLGGAPSAGSGSPPPASPAPTAPVDGAGGTGSAAG